MDTETLAEGGLAKAKEWQALTGRARGWGFWRVPGLWHSHPAWTEHLLDLSPCAWHQAKAISTAERLLPFAGTEKRAFFFFFPPMEHQKSKSSASESSHYRAAGQRDAAELGTQMLG